MLTNVSLSPCHHDCKSGCSRRLTHGLFASSRLRVVQSSFLEPDAPTLRVILRYPAAAMGGENVCFQQAGGRNGAPAARAVSRAVFTFSAGSAASSTARQAEAIVAEDMARPYRTRRSRQ